jgi:hypothetical protein
MVFAALHSAFFNALFFLLSAHASAIRQCDVPTQKNVSVRTVILDRMFNHNLAHPTCVPERIGECMTTSIRFPWFQTGYVAAAVCLTIGTSCLLPERGLMRAVMTFGTDVRLPLQRIVTDNREPAHITDVSERLHSSASGSTHAQSPAHLWEERSDRADLGASSATRQEHND